MSAPELEPFGAPRIPPRSDSPPPIVDPYASVYVPPPTRSRLSGLAITSVVALVFGPVGAIAAVLFGVAALREISASRGLAKGRRLAGFGVVGGAVATVAWGAMLAMALLARRPAPMDGPAPRAEMSERRTEPVPAPDLVPSVPAPTPAGGTVPKATEVHKVGHVTVVDVGVSSKSLADELAKQRAIAAKAQENLVVMLTGDPCAPCRGVDQSMQSSLVQAALAKVRLVRVDIDVFREDLDELRMPHERYPAFYLLGADLSPRDGIDGGEWDEDVPENIAPVLGAFVRGKYATRRTPWRAVPGSGISL